MFTNRSKQATDQPISIPAVLLSTRDGSLSPAVGPQRKLVSEAVPAGQWVMQCLEDLSWQWLGTIISDELSKNGDLQSVLIQAGDGNDLLVLIDKGEIPNSVAKVQLILTAVVAVGTAADVESGEEGTIRPSDQLWPFVALAKQEDPSSCLFVWMVRDASLPYHTESLTVEKNRQKRSAMRLVFQRTGDSLILIDVTDVTDPPNDFWRV